MLTCACIIAATLAITTSLATPSCPAALIRATAKYNIAAAPVPVTLVTAGGCARGIGSAASPIPMSRHLDFAVLASVPYSCHFHWYRSFV